MTHTFKRKETAQTFTGRAEGRVGKQIRERIRAAEKSRMIKWEEAKKIIEKW